MRPARRVGVPAAMLFGLQVVTFVFLSDRGLDFTDEAFYLLNFEHGRELAAMSTLFGLFFEAPFRLLDGNIAAMRIFGLVLLASTGGLLAWSAFRFVHPDDESVPWSFVVAGVACSLLYYSHLPTLRTPSYNLLVLACLEVSTALLLEMANPRATPARLRAGAVAYGMALGVCALTKAPSALAVAACHLAFLLGVAPSRQLAGWAALACAGAMGIALAVTAAFPHWIDALLAGVEVTWALGAVSPGYSMTTTVAMGVGVATLVGAATSLRRVVAMRITPNWGLACVACTTVPFMWQRAAGAWWPMMVASTALVWLIAERSAPGQALGDRIARRRFLGLALLLLTMPLCFSIGTNTVLAVHSRMAGGLALLAPLLVFYRLATQGQVGTAALAAALTLPCVPSLVGQWNAWSDPATTYRLGSSLADQQRPTVIGPAGGTVRLDAPTHDAVQALKRKMADAGFGAGTPVLDVTGDGPGLVYIVGGRPLGAAWLVGGYPGSERAATLALASVPVVDLRHAWVISNDDSTRALRSWPDLLRRPGGEPAALEAVGTVEWSRRYTRPGAEPVSPPRLTLWRPAR